MRNHLIKKDSKGYFEGWYFKHQSHNQTISFIPGMHIPKEGKPFAFIQIVTNQKSYFIKYPYKDFYANKELLFIKIGSNVFSRNGIAININTPKLRLSGKVYYGKLTPIAYDIMGPFALIPNMECNHGIISLRHSLYGNFSINDTFINVKNVIGYIEKDWGISFPKSYTWLHCNDFKDKTSIVVSTAHIPFYNFSFQGLIAIVYYKEKEYRFATYNGGKVIYATKHQLIIKKGPYALKVTIAKGKSHPLQAPTLGDMSRIIHERPSCPAVFEFFIGYKKVFIKYSENASFEYVNFND